MVKMEYWKRYSIFFAFFGKNGQFVEQNKEILSI